MTKIDSFSPRLAPLAPVPQTTIYRDAPLPESPPSAVRLSPSGVHPLVWPDERISDGILLGLAALMLPTVMYSLMQASNLVSSGSLEHAIRAFLP